jgi:hypothetical protein
VTTMLQRVVAATHAPKTSVQSCHVVLHQFPCKLKSAR